jgi:hypothetical protein
MYFGPYPTLAQFQAFCLGYIYAKDGVGGSEYMQFDYDFSAYIRKAGSCENIHWSGIISKLYDNEEQKIEEFRFLLVQFNNDHMKQ